jgi:GNAT superfamily N-acetyltransferase
MIIRYFEGFNRTPATVLAVRGWLDLNERGLGEPVLNLSWDANVIGAFDGETCVGVIVWQHVKWSKQIFIDLSYVDPAARRHGVYRAMWDALVVKAQEIGVAFIYGITDAANEAMRAVAKEVGREECGISLRFAVPLRTEAA